MERLWVEFNKRVNYPIKYILVKMEEEGILDMDLPVDRFCVSWFTLNIANIGVLYQVCGISVSSADKVQPSHN